MPATHVPTSIFCFLLQTFWGKALSIAAGIVISLLIFSGCTVNNAETKISGRSGLTEAGKYIHFPDKKHDITAQVSKINKSHAERLKKQQNKKIKAEPLIPRYDPLEDHKVSFSMVDARLDTIFYIIADTVGMNLVLDDAIKAKEDTVTLRFKNVSAKTVLDELAEKFDLDYKITGNILRINTYAERFFSLNFLDTNVAMSFDVGGDVLGGDETKTASGLSGNVTMQGKGAEKGNPYSVLKKMISAVKSKNGIFTMNSLSGSIYVKDKPSIVKNIAKIINHFKDVLSRQILINARIIEVTLSHGYEYGINWDVLRNELSGVKSTNLTSIKLKHAAWNVTDGLVLDGFNSTFSLSSITNALQTFGNIKIISNPTIRAKHGRPSIISVGDSISYKKSVTVTKTANSTGTGSDTDVEVDVSSVFDGLILGVIPFIEDNGRINLMINPIKSDVDTESINKLQDVGGGNTISLPKVGIKEISTTISLKDGNVIVLGGLISSEKEKNDKNVPILSHIPGLGYLFKNKYMTEKRKELVIVLKVDVI